MSQQKRAIGRPLFIAAVVVGGGLALAPIQGTAWADSTTSGSASSASHGADRTKSAEHKTAGPKSHAKSNRRVVDTGPKSAGTSASVRSAPSKPLRPSGKSVTVTIDTAPTKPPVPGVRVGRTPASAITVPTMPGPAPLSPVAQLLELPGQLVNTAMQLLDITTSADSPPSPIDFAPLNDLFFAATRELEHLAGLDRTPPAQPTVPTLTYTGPTTRPTPTVGEFLNASAAGSVLGARPGGLTPFVVDGFQMSSVQTFSGMAADVWVTPEDQLIIAYRGTSGGTHAVFNPVIAISQVLADVQMALTGTTPQGFDDAVDFAARVRAAAVLQGYGDDDIFVTGHSLGGWQAQYVAQQTGRAGVGFEAPGINTIVPGNGADAMFVNIGSYGSPASYVSTDLPGLQPFMPAYVAGGGSKPHYGPIIMLGDPSAMTPLYNASQLWGTSLVGSAIFLLDFLNNLGQFHMVGVQAYNLDSALDPGIVQWLGTKQGDIHTGYGELTIPQLLKAASDDGILLTP